MLNIVSTYVDWQ